MFVWFDRFLRRRDGNSAVELALTLPLVLLVLTGIVEFGRAMYQTTLLERGLRAAGLYGARSDLPISAETRERMERIAKTGSLDTGEPYLLNAWQDASSEFNISIGSYTVDGKDISVIEVEASVPYDTLIPGLFNMFGFEGFSLYARHQQAYIGQ